MRRSSFTLPSILALAAVAALSVSAIASAKPKPITGKLSKSGYTVLALADSGKATSTRVKSRRFSLRPPAQRVTLHLRKSDGTYAGPIVLDVRQRGRRVVVGTKAGAKLGTIRIKPSRGYAKVGRLTKRLQKQSFNPNRLARARRGVPTGAGNFGLVSSRVVKTPRADNDLDGVPDPLDVDDDGDRILDNLDVAISGQARATAVDEPAFGMTPTLTVPIADTINANAGGLTEQQRDAVFARFGRLSIGILPGDSTELDCGGRPNKANPTGWIGGLPYCVRGGTGGAFLVPAPPGKPPAFPDGYDPDQDGFGSLVPVSTGSPGMGLVFGGKVDDVNSGDVLIQRVTTNGVETAYPATLQYVFGSIPAMASYSDETMVTPQTISYPIVGGQGSTGNGFVVNDGPEDVDSDIELTLTFWRPQRLRTAGDPGGSQWMDIGHLTYTLAGFFGPGGKQFCPQNTFTTADPMLATPPSDFPAGGGFTDSSSDQPVNPMSTLAFKLNLTQCLQANGTSFEPGQEVGLILRAYGRNWDDSAEQQFAVKRAP